MSMISKQIDDLRAYAKDRKGELAKLVSDAADTIEMLSAKLSAANTERSARYYHGGWIPCSERLPDEHEWLGTKKFGTTISNEVYVTFEAPDGQRFAKHISFQNGKLSPVDEQRMKVWFKGAKPIAWMPLPDPYEGNDEEKKNEDSGK